MKQYKARTLKRVVSGVILAVMLCGIPAMAAELPREVVPGGHTLGIKVYTDGVLIANTAPVMTPEGEKDPAGLAGLETGDRITHINDKPIQSAKELQDAVKASDGEEMLVRLCREGRTLEVRVRPVHCSADGGARLGVWVKDSMAGIGTITFYDPKTGLFGALGHGVSDSGGALLPISSGTAIPSVVEQVKQGLPGTPGELQGAFDADVVGGDLLKNTESGLFGILREPSMLGRDNVETIPVATAEEIKVGQATILANVEGNKVAPYDIEITRIMLEKGKIKNFMIKVCDPMLLETTGGIVQGMSGSPILQNGKLAGAVTHVLVNDPKRGYGIFIQNMLEEGVKSLQPGFLVAS